MVAYNALPRQGWYLGYPPSNAHRTVVQPGRSARPAAELEKAFWKLRTLLDVFLEQAFWKLRTLLDAIPKRRMVRDLHRYAE